MTDVSIKDKAVLDIFTDACETTSHIWADFRTYRWATDTDTPDYEGFAAKVTVEDLEDHPVEFTIDKAAVLKGLALAAGPKPVKHLSHTARALARAVLAGDPDWDEWHDGFTADQIVQVGLFGEVVFG